MKFDCGTDIMVISVEYYNRLLKDTVQLRKPDRKLFDPAKQFLLLKCLMQNYNLDNRLLTGLHFS